MTGLPGSAGESFELARTWLVKLPGVQSDEDIARPEPKDVRVSNDENDSVWEEICRPAAGRGRLGEFDQLGKSSAKNDRADSGTAASNTALAE